MLNILLILLVLLMFMAFFEDYISERDRLWLYIGTATVMALVAGFRPDDVDKDYDNYVRFYYSFDFTTEISYIFIAQLVRTTIDDVSAVFAIYAFLTMTLIAAAIKKISPWLLSSLLIYLSQNYMLHGMTQIRVAVASAIFLLALPALLRGERVKYLLIILCAILFHYTSVVYLFFALLSGKELKGLWTYIWIGIIPVCMILSALHINLITMIPIPYFEEKLKAYEILMSQGEGSEINPFNAVLLVRVAMVAFVVWKIKLMRTFSPYVDLLLKIEIIGLCTLLLLTAIPVVAFRISEMICVVEIMLYPLFAITVKPRWAGKATVMLIAAAFFYITVFYNKTMLIV